MKPTVEELREMDRELAAMMRSYKFVGGQRMIAQCSECVGSLTADDLESHACPKCGPFDGVRDVQVRLSGNN